MSKPTLTILSFDPLQLQLPDAPFACQEVVVRLPPVHCKLLDLSLGGIIPGYRYLSADLPLTAITLTFAEPATLGEIADLIAKSPDHWRAVWQATQRFADDYGPIFK